MAPGKRRKCDDQPCHPPVFAGVKAILVPSWYGETKVGWSVVQKRFAELHGTVVNVITPETTHVVAGTWLSVIQKWSWSYINDARNFRGLKVVEVAWIVDSIKHRAVQDTEQYDLWEDEEASASAQLEQQVWESKERLANLHYGPVITKAQSSRRLKRLLMEDLNQTNSILRGVSVVFVEEGIGKVKCRVYKTKVVDLGGTVEESLTDATTHVITKSYPKACRKLGKSEMRFYVMEHNVFVVSPAWLVESAAAGKVEKHGDFDLFEAWPRKNQVHYVSSSDEWVISDSESG